MRTGTLAISFLATAFLWLALGSQASAQTLTEKLLTESPTKLAEQAKRDGNIVRGAILFHQGNINCAKCHRLTSEQDRIGPDLSRMAPEVTDASIVESILQPSKQFTAGFEPVIVLTNDGRIISGTQVSEEADRIVIRESQSIDELTTIARKDLDEIRPGRKSNMPDNLVDELKNRQQFLDLLRYVIDIKDRGPDSGANAMRIVMRRELNPELSGVMLIQKMNCAACHGSDSIQSSIAAKQAPQLTWSAKWLSPKYIESFIANPHVKKPGTTMPGVLGHLDEAARKDAATTITHFLMTEAGNEYEVQSIGGEASHRGFQLFHSVGCVACHAPRDESAVEQPLGESTPLGELHEKYNVSGLASFLEDPLAVRHSGHMPNMQLSHREAVDIANFLLQGIAEASEQSNAQTTRESWKPNAELAQLGKSLFTKHNCASCHSNVVVSTELIAATRLGKLNPELGCLSVADANRDGQWPTFQLTDVERAQIQSALRNPPGKLSDNQQIELTLVSYNCISCHSRSDLGGVTSKRNPHFQTSNLNLGDQGRIPPTLTGVGAKLNSKWMRDVLVNHRSIRPYMNTRMPQFGEENIGHLLALFESNDRLPKTEFAEFKDQKEMRMRGLELAGNQGLNCVACHTYQYKLSDTMPAVDLTEMTERLKKDWFYQYMLSPQQFSPNTVMPSFWPGGNAIRSDIEGSPEEQLETLWQYLIDGRQARAPSGVVRKPLEIIVNNEAQMLRRSYPGIGKRGIGVGYPGGVNIAFDAEQMRLGSIWKGKFADPSGVWTGQGSGKVRPMGRAIEFAKGPELDSQTKPWVVDDGRPPNHQFKGYALDQRQRPTFRYTMESESTIINVKDFFTEAIDGELGNGEDNRAYIKRRLSFLAERDYAGLSFRIALDKNITKVADNIFSIGKQLTIHVAADQPARVVRDGDRQRLEIPIDLTANKEKPLLIEYHWK